MLLRLTASSAHPRAMPLWTSFARFNRGLPVVVACIAQRNAYFDRGRCIGTRVAKRETHKTEVHLDPGPSFRQGVAEPKMHHRAIPRASIADGKAMKPLTKYINMLV